MIEIKIPGHQTLRLAHLVLDFNGTIAIDGNIIDGVHELLTRLSADMQIHVVTADTFGTARGMLSGMPYTLFVLPAREQIQAKADYVEKLGAEQTVCIGNGRNDSLMLKISALGVAVLQQEGAAADTMRAADVVCSSITDACELFLHPQRLVATLRS